MRSYKVKRPGHIWFYVLKPGNTLSSQTHVAGECFDMGYEKGKEFATVSTLKLLNNKGIRIPKKLQSNFVVISEPFLLH
ncbi:hypothetical protein F5ESL0230_05610 [Lactobacillus sp. ESL0230]|nr:hypothetical protein F5ESL0230_05610 [Lactobacillus sp. ESL0230]